MTLLRNAAQAIEKKGTITIKTSSDENNVYVKISDTGKGMPTEKVKMLFEFGFIQSGKISQASYNFHNSFTGR
ncbi:MAG: ATP-binding protein [Candidatus Poribacteria bacterium]